MIATQSTVTPAFTVEGVTYVIKMGSTNRVPGRVREIEWYVVAFAQDLGWQRHVPLAGPFETKSKAAETLELYLNQASYRSMACDEIVRATEKIV